MATDIKYKLADYDGGLESHPVPESDGQLWLVGSWWELHFAHIKQFVNGELADYVLEASPSDKRACLVSIRGSGSDRGVQCSFVLPRTPAERFTSELGKRLRELDAERAGCGVGFPVGRPCCRRAGRRRGFPGPHANGCWAFA